MRRRIDNRKGALRRSLAIALLIWTSLGLFVFTALLLLPHEETSVPILMEQMCLIGIGVLSWVVFLREQSPKVRLLFFCFFLFGFVGQVVEILVLFITPLLSKQDPYVSAFTFQYSTILSLLCFCFAVTSVWIVGTDRWKRAGIVAATIIVGLFVEVFGDYMIMPQSLYLHPDITDFRIIDRAAQELERQNMVVSESNISTVISLSRWNGKRRVGELSFEERRRKVKEILPYTKESNYILLIFRPLFREIVLVTGVCIVILLSVLVRQLWRDPPVGAYLDKISAAVFFFATFRYVHYAWYAESTDWEICIRNFNIGAGFSIISLIVLSVLFMLRLRFISSDEGKYYEKGIADNPRGITRWRDGIDNLVLRRFLGDSAIRRRFLVADDSVILRKKNEKTLDK